MNSAEVWKPCPLGEQTYEVSSLGRVRSVDRVIVTQAGYRQRRPGRVLRPVLAGSGYPYINIYRGGEARFIAVHRLVALAFVANPEGKREVNHIDGNKTNNAVGNLEWVTPKENVAHAIRTGLSKLYGPAKINQSTAREIRQRLRGGERGKDLAAEYGLSKAAVSRIKNGHAWA